MSEVLRYKAIKLKTEAGNIITYTPHGPDFVPAEAYDQLRAELAALKAGQGEAVAWECQTFHDDNTVTPGWSAWERVEARHPHETVAGMVAELQDYIAQGYRYRLRALYTAPPASADAVSVPREMAARLCSTDNHVRQTARRELRNMLVAQGVKP